MMCEEGHKDGLEYKDSLNWVVERPSLNDEKAERHPALHSPEEMHV